ncbi:MAG: GNAT family N-acetyltransferase [Bacteroidota bacterium]
MLATELEALNAIAWAAKSHWGYPAAWMELWRDDLTLQPEHLNQMRIEVAEANHVPLAWIAWQSHPNYWEIEHLWVHPTHHRKGLGKQLFSHGLQRYIPSQADIRVVADPNAIPFYEKLGFCMFEQLPSKIPGRVLPFMQRKPESSHSLL